MVVLPLPEEEIETNQPNIDILDGFIKDVHVWLSELKRQTTHDVIWKWPYIPVAQENESEMHTTVESENVTVEPSIIHIPDEIENLSTVNTDDVGPHDSVSNVSKSKSTRKSTTSKASSSTSSARIIAQNRWLSWIKDIRLQQRNNSQSNRNNSECKMRNLKWTKLAAANAKAQVLIRERFKNINGVKLRHKRSSCCCYSKENNIKSKHILTCSDTTKR